MSVRSVAQAGLSGVGKRPALTSAYDRSSFPGSFELISRVEVGAGGASSIEFTSIPGTYQHLQVRGITRVDTGTVQIGLSVRLNGVTSSDYAVHILYGDGSTVSAAGAASNTNPYVLETIGASATAGAFAGFVLDIVDYASTSKATTMRGFSGSDANGLGQVRLGSGLWTSTSAVTSLSLQNPSSFNFAQYSRASLYGVIRNG